MRIILNDEIVRPKAMLEIKLYVSFTRSKAILEIKLMTLTLISIVRIECLPIGQKL